ncbi:MAG: preprotein translocase subunit Sec61beta [Methanosarcinaceae archaeon]|nr:preprotein translocase subunit Sec61beta [Methanosarcinaceae archaeon]
MAKKKSSGLQSSAGLMRYYEADKNSIKIPPQAILVSGILVVLVVLGVSYMYGTWPIIG